MRDFDGLDELNKILWDYGEFWSNNLKFQKLESLYSCSTSKEITSQVVGLAYGLDFFESVYKLILTLGFQIILKAPKLILKSLVGLLFKY